MIYDLDIDNNRGSILSGKSIVGFRDGPIEDALFDHPDGVAYVNNNIFVADTYNHRIRLINFEHGKRVVTTFAVYAMLI